MFRLIGKILNKSISNIEIMTQNYLIKYLHFFYYVVHSMKPKDKKEHRSHVSNFYSI